MRERIDWTPEESAPERADVLRLQGIGPGDRVPPRTDALIDAASRMYLDTAEPRAVLAEIPAAEFAGVYRGEGLNSHETPLEAIYPKATRLALVAATVGARVSLRVRELFLQHDLATGCLLDSIASAAADRLADLAGPRFVSMIAESEADWRVLTYSPGYCGWHVSGQRALFGYLRPEEIGITLNASFLMQPLKSISGVLVAGPGHIHRFHPTFSFCERCKEKQCRDRMASASKC